MNRHLWTGLLAALIGSAAVLLLFSSAWLPDPVASHFDVAGVPNGHLPLRTYLAMMAGLMIALPLFIAVLVPWEARCGKRGIRIANREVWLAEPRRGETLAFIGSHAVRLACVLVLLLAYVHVLVIEANRSVPVQLSMPALAAGGLVFGVGLLAWWLTLRQRFQTLP